MTDIPRQGGIVIILTFLVAFMLTAVPLPEWAAAWRPVWVAMVLIYWCMAIPDRIGIGIAWLIGLLLDVQQGALLGQNALGLSIVAFITLAGYRRIRVFSLVKQALVVCSILFVYLFLMLWVRTMIGYPPQHWSFWMPIVTSMLLWPWLFIILRDLRRTYRVS
jgi:rod shape-determining protein MreD